MDIIEIWWDATQQAEINELRTKVEATANNSRTTIALQAELIRLLQRESDDLRLRLGVLIRLLVQQGTLSAEQFSAAITEAKASIALAQEQTRKKAVARPHPKPLRPVALKAV